MKLITYALIGMLVIASLINPLTTYSQLSTDEFRVVNVEWSTPYGASIAPGDVVTLTLVLKYVGNSQVQGLVGTLELPSSIQPYGSDRAVATFNNLITPSTPYVTLKYSLKIAVNAGTGLYTLVLELRYSELINGTWVSRCEYEYIKLLITGRPDVRVINYSPNILYVGTQLINLTIGNLGSYVAREVSIEVTSPSITVINGSKYLGDLSTGKNLSTSVLIYVPQGIKSSVATLNVIIKYLMPDGTWREVSNSLQFIIGNEEIPKLSIELLNNTLLVGEGTTYLMIRNLGNYTVSNVSISVSSSEVGTEVESLNTTSLAPNQSLIATIITYVPTRYLGASAHLQVIINFIDDYGVPRSITKSFTLPVTEGIESLIKVRPNSLIIRSGTSVIKLYVINEGPEVLKDVRVVTEFLNYAEVLNGSVTYIPYLRPNESKELVLQVKVPSLDYLLTTSLKLSINYFSRGIAESVTKYVKVTLVPSGFGGLSIELLSREVKSPSLSNLMFKIINGLGYVINSLVINVKSESQLIKVLNSTFTIPKLLPNESVKASIPILVTYGTSGTAVIEVQVSYVGPMGLSHNYVGKYLIKVVDSLPKLVIDANPRTLYSSSLSDLSLIISNEGGDAYDVKVTVSTQQSCLAILKSVPTYVGLIKGGSDRVLRIPIKVPEINSLTTCKLIINIDYLDVLGNEHSSTYSLDLTLVPMTKSSLINAVLITKVFKALSNETLAIELMSKSDVHNLTLSFEDLGPLIPIKSLGDVYVGDLVRNSKLTIKLPIKVPNTSGTYELSIKLTYVDPLGIKHVEVCGLSYSIVPTTGYVSIEVSPLRIKALSNASLVITIRNLLPHTLRSTYLNIELPQQLVPSGSTTYFLGDLRPNSTTKVSVPIITPYVSSPQAVKLVIKLTYVDPLANTHLVSKSVNIELLPTSTAYLRVLVSPTELVIGRENYIFINLSNPMNHSVEGIEVSLSTSPHLLLLNESRLYLGSLGPNSWRLLKLLAYVPSTASTSSSIILSIKYLDSVSGVMKSFTTSRTLLLRGIINLTLTDVAVIPETPLPGQPFSITLTITNVGTSTAYAVRASALTEGLPIRTFGPKSVYVGNAEVNSPVTFTLNLMLERGVRGVIKVPIQLTYMDNLRSVHTKVFYVEVKLSKSLSTPLRSGGSRLKGSSTSSLSTQGINPSLLIITAFVVGALVGALTTYYLRRGRAGLR